MTGSGEANNAHNRLNWAFQSEWMPTNARPILEI